jgi:hypothetical protein
MKETNVFCLWFYNKTEETSSPSEPEEALIRSSQVNHEEV